jgi:hypothetical protein
MVCAGQTCVALFALEGAAEAAPGRGAIAMRHLAFRVDRAGLERAQVELAERGIHFDFMDHETAHSVYFADPDGHRLEITRTNSRRYITAAELQTGTCVVSPSISGTTTHRSRQDYFFPSSSSTARNASWGTSIWPTCFMRFFPAFCFSSSLRLRVTSPP